jgi:hypothetical protein
MLKLEAVRPGEKDDAGVGRNDGVHDSSMLWEL